MDWFLVLLGLAVALLLSVGLWLIGEWNVFAYGAGVCVGGMIAALGMMFDQYNNRSSASQAPR